MKASIFFVILFLQNNVFSQDLQLGLQISNLETTNGSIIVKVYYNSKAYDEDIPNIFKHIPKKGNISNGIFKTQLLLPEGTYGIAFVDDENNNKKMDYNFIGMPKEGFGFAGFYLEGFSKPVFSDFSFKLTKDSEFVDVKLRYM